jgi:type IV secretory pathway TraG/TraD family ATPase VirD4
LLKHRGPAIVLLNKTDVLHAAAEHRAHFGPVDVFAPLNAGRRAYSP